MAAQAWMSPELRKVFSDVEKGLRFLRKRNRELVPKLKDRTISKTEAAELRQVNKPFTALEGHRQRILAMNPYTVENILKALRRAKT